MGKVNQIFYYALLLFALFPVIPNNLKGLPVILLFLCALLFFFSGIKQQINYKKVLINSSLYIIYLISLLYSPILEDVDQTLTTRLSILVFPLLFAIASPMIKTIDQRQINTFLRLFFFSTTCYTLLIVIFFYQLGFLSNDVSVSLFYSHLTYEMWSISQHPIYASMFIALAILFGVKLLPHSDRSHRIFIFIGLIILTGMLIFLSRKGVIFALILALVPLLMAYLKSRTTKITTAAIVVIFLSTLIALTFTQNRFKELFKTASYNDLSATNSTSIRLGIYQCSFEVIKQKPLLGHGIAGVKTKLRICYEKTSKILLKEVYNSHNQYLSITISNGVVGLLIFLIFLLVNFKLAMTTENRIFLSVLLFFSVLMLFENLLERQSGVILFAFFINFWSFKEKNI